MMKKRERKFLLRLAKELDIESFELEEYIVTTKDPYTIAHRELMNRYDEIHESYGVAKRLLLLNLDKK